MDVGEEKVEDENDKLVASFGPYLPGHELVREDEEKEDGGEEADKAESDDGTQPWIDVFWQHKGPGQGVWWGQRGHCSRGLVTLSRL